MSRKRKNKTPESVRRLNAEYRSGGFLVDREERCRDVLEDFARLEGRPFELGAALAWMGIGENGDEPDID